MVFSSATMKTLVPGVLLLYGKGVRCSSVLALNEVVLSKRASILVRGTIILLYIRGIVRVRVEQKYRVVCNTDELPPPGPLP